MSSYIATPQVQSDTSLILGKVMGLVAAALAVCAGATVLGSDLSFETARIFSFAGLGLLIGSSFVDALRRGVLGVITLGVIATLIGLGLGPFIGMTNPADLTTAVALTALIVLAMGSIGFVMSKDTVRFMRPLSLIVFVSVIISILAMVFGGLGTLSPVLSIVILFASAALILVDFNYVRKHADDDDIVWLATGIFVSIINIFISLLNLMNR